MQIVLREDMEKVGKKGDIVDVADGFARNFLIPRGHAIKATDGIAAQATAMRANRDRHDKKNREAAQLVATKLTGVAVKVEARAGGEGKLFGSIGTHDIADALTASGVEVAKSEVRLPNGTIRNVGEYDVAVHLHSDVEATVRVVVVAA